VHCRRVNVEAIGRLEREGGLRTEGFRQTPMRAWPPWLAAGERLHEPGLHLPNGRPQRRLRRRTGLKFRTLLDPLPWPR
jgi:hypothetical protein